MAQYTIFALIIQVISSNPKAYSEACADPMVYNELLCLDNPASGIYHLYMSHSSILREVPFLVEEDTINAIKQALAMPNNHWHVYNRASLEEIAAAIRIELSGRPVITFR
jgi:hypothetical protein